MLLNHNPNYTIEDLINLIKEKHPDANFDFIRKAYNFAENAHKGQKRATGEDYIIHPLHTARNLALIDMPEKLIAAGLLHDVPEDTEYTLDDIEKEFGKDIRSMIEGITKLGKLKYRGRKRYIENLRKMFVAMANDLRVILIKFADRIHNLTTLDALPEDKQLRIARESLEIYAPIANRLGINKYQAALELLSFKYTNPEDYAWVMYLLERKETKKKQAQMNKDIELLKKELTKNNIQVLEIYGRAKHPYSLYRKLLRRDRDIDKIYDLIAMRVIVKDIADCYMTLGVIHQLWKPLSGRIKDYIAQPKINGYQSLHTTVFDDSKMITEIQIRTPEIHRNAELGIAAHWIYDENKDNISKPKLNENHLKWLEELRKWQEEIQKNPNAIDQMKLDIFNNRCYVFTPKGDVIELPEDATPVDFAYKIHTDIGNQCAGAYVNNKYVPLDTKLKNGDLVEIIIDKNRKKPNPQWLKFVKTRVARTNIKQQNRSILSNFFNFHKHK